MGKKTIAVFGATGSQGGSVANALFDENSFNVRALTRNPATYAGKSHEVVFADLNDFGSLKEALKDCYGVFVVTDFWGGADEIAQGKNAVEAAKAAGVQHFIWSTLPDVELISEGEFHVPHFTNKAKVDEIVKIAHFKYSTFVEAPFYYQNLLGWLAPRSKQDGTTGWTLPIDPTKQVIHWSDINDMGKVVAGALLQPEKAGNGNYLSLAAELNSFNDIIETYKNFGKYYSFSQVPIEVFSTFSERAKEMAEMFSYWEKYTYMGPDSERKVLAAKEISTSDLVNFDVWLGQQE